MKVVVVTNVDMGWDCVVGVYSSLEKALRDIYETQGDGSTNKTLKDIERELSDEGYVFFKRGVDA